MMLSVVEALLHHRSQTSLYYHDTISSSLSFVIILPPQHVYAQFESTTMRARLLEDVISKESYSQWTLPYGLVISLDGRPIP